MFGKRVSEYLAFEKVWLFLIAAVGLVRLGVSLAGWPDRTAAWFSMNVVVWAGCLYYGAAVHTRGFGSYRQLLPLMIFAMLTMQSIAVLGILLSIAGTANVFTAPEFSFGVQSQWIHLLAHLTIGLVMPPLLLWAVSSVVMRVTKKVSRRPAVA
jgi:hypothetical protein